MFAGNHNYSNSGENFELLGYRVERIKRYNVFTPNWTRTDGEKFKNLGMKKMEIEKFTSRGIRRNFFFLFFSNGTVNCHWIKHLFKHFFKTLSLFCTVDCSEKYFNRIWEIKEHWIYLFIYPLTLNFTIILQLREY